MNKQELLNKINVLQSKQCAMQAEINQLKEQAERVDEKPNPRWVPCGGEKYYYASDHGKTYSVTWDAHTIDKDRFSIGNVFKTKEEAEFALERLKVIAELKEYASEFVAGKDNHYLCYDCECNTIEYDWVFWRKRNDIYFPSEKTAQQAVKAVGEERVKTYYLGVK